MEVRLNYIEKEIIRTLYKESIPITVNELSQKTGISWVTTKKYVEKLKTKGIVKTYTLPSMKKYKIMFNFAFFPNPTLS